MKRYIKSSIFSDCIDYLLGVFYFDDINDAKCQATISSHVILSTEDESADIFRETASLDG